MNVAPLENRQRILEHLLLYRVTNIDAVHRLFFAGKSREAARVALWRLAEAELLTRFEIRNRSFYQLGRKGCAEIGAPRNAAEPFAAQSLLERYAFLGFCLQKPEERTRLTWEDLIEVAPEVKTSRGIDPSLQHYYLDEHEGNLRVGRVTIDNGSEMGRLLDKCRQIVEEALNGPFVSLIRQGAFEVTLLTAYEVKRTRLLRLLERDPLSLSVQVVTVEEMKHLL